MMVDKFHHLFMSIFFMNVAFMAMQQTSTDRIFVVLMVLSFLGSAIHCFLYIKENE